MKDSIYLFLYIYRGILEFYNNNIKYLLAFIANDNKLISIIKIYLLLIKETSIVYNTNIPIILYHNNKIRL